MALATHGVSFTALTVTTNVSSPKRVPASVARTTIVAVPLESAAKLRSSALSAPIVGVNSPGLLLLSILKVRALPSSTSVKTLLRSR